MNMKLLIVFFALMSFVTSLLQLKPASANINYCRSICDPDMGASCGRIGPSRIYCYNSMAECMNSCAY